MEGINVSIKSSTSAGTTIAVNSQSLGSSQPSGTGETKLGTPIFYDVSVQGVPDGVATVSITNDAVQPKTQMKYWDGSKWVSVTNQSVKGKTIRGDIPVRALHGTPIAIGT